MPETQQPDAAARRLLARLEVLRAAADQLRTARNDYLWRDSERNRQALLDAGAAMAECLADNLVWPTGRPRKRPGAV